MNAPTPSGYRSPPAAIAELVDAPATPQVFVDPTRSLMAVATPADRPHVTELARPEIRLAGLRIDPSVHGPSREERYTGAFLWTIADGEERPLRGLPEAPRIGHLRFSPDGRRLAFTLRNEAGIALWVADVDDGSARPLTEPLLNAVFGTPFAWLPHADALVCRLVAADGPEPTPSVSPAVQQNEGRPAPARTYQDLLTSPYDESLFEHYATAQAVRVSLEGHARPLGDPGILRGLRPSPDGRLLLVDRVVGPFSYLVPHGRFAHQVEIWNADGQLVRRLADLPLAEGVPVDFDAVPDGPRSFAWRDDVPASVHWVEALDGGDPTREVARRDRLVVLAAPFDGDAVTLAKLEYRFAGVRWGRDDLALVSERWWKTRWTRTWRLDPSGPRCAATPLFDRSFDDRYADPGRPMMQPTAAGGSVLLVEEESLSLAGDGASPEGDRPFLDRLDLAEGVSERLWRSQAPHYEAPVVLVDPGRRLLLTRREAVAEQPNLHLRDLSRGTDRPVTDFAHPTPQLRDVHKELVRYRRDDGVELTATLYLPPGKTPDDGPFPTLLWAYPREFKSAAAASQVTDSPYRFVRVGWGSPLFLLVHGYAVLDGPTMPIVGEGDIEANDTYVEQLVASARAAVDEVVRRGVAEPGRVAVGGHSYGAFMTANLLVHSDLFAAGIARSGAYNRTLTPCGFQAEERTLWQAPATYAAMSPFMHADKITAPLLLIHGEADDNSGTFPLQSQRFYGALKGHGATVRLVMLPHESHGYRARESVLHMLHEMAAWLDRWLGSVQKGG